MRTAGMALFCAATFNTTACWAASDAPAAAWPQGIPLGMFWRGIFPAMLLVLAMAVVVSFGYAQLRKEVARRRQAEIRLKAARDLADSASLAKASFFATMSHEIRTPMSGIIGMLDLLKRASMQGEQRQMLVAVDHAANSLLQILDDVLDFSKMEANRMHLESVPVDLRALVRSVIMVIGEPARRRGVKTECRIDAGAAHEILGDPLRIRQILSNLLSNAAKFTRQGEIVLAVTVEHIGTTDQLLRFTVTDTGIGIAPDRLERLVSPFQQADAATSRQYGGTGLGLSVSSRLAALMDGRLRLTSELGQGTQAEFTCRFAVHRGRDDTDRGGSPAAVERVEAHARVEGPHAAAAAQAAATQVAATQVAAAQTAAAQAAVPSAGAAPACAAGSLQVLAAPRILVADDHAINRDLVRRQLTALGYSCDVMEDAAAALEALQARPYGLLLTDCQMPPMNGRELARQWRAIEQREPGSGRMPIVLMSASMAAAAPVPDDEIDARLFKPIKLEHLRAALLQHLPPAVRTPAPDDEEAWAAVAATAQAPGASGTGLAWDALCVQFGGEAAAGRFVQASAALLRTDLTRAQQELCAQFCRQFAEWMHRTVGAMGMLGHWQAMEEGAVLERSLRQSAGAAPLAEILPFLRRLEQAVEDIERQAAKS
jgi:signal transduction histidine kinase/DNA-binding response OmpR family regulator